MKDMKLPENQRIIYLLLVVAVLIVYFPVFQNDFLYFWDDQWVVINYYTSGGITLDNLYHILTD